MEKYIKYVPLILFCALAIKALIVGSVIADAPFLLILAVLSGFYEYNHQSKKLQVIHKRCDEIDKHLTALYKANQDLKTDLQTSKLSSQFQKISGITK